MHNESVVPEHIHAVDHMRGDKHGAPLVSHFLNQRFQLLDGVGVKTDHRLIHQQKLRAGQKPQTQIQLLLHTLGELVAEFLFLIGQLKAVEKLVGIVAPVSETVGARDELGVLRYGEVGVERGDLGYVAEHALGGHALVVMPRHADVAPIAQKAHNGFDQRGFPRPVRAQKHRHTATIKMKAYVVAGHGLAVAFSEMRYGQHSSSLL